MSCVVVVVVVAVAVVVDNIVFVYVRMILATYPEAAVPKRLKPDVFVFSVTEFVLQTSVFTVTIKDRTVITVHNNTCNVIVDVD